MLSSARLRPNARPRRRLDLRPFPGRNRLERTMHWLRAHFPRSQSWSEPTLREIAERVIADSEIVD